MQIASCNGSTRQQFRMESAGGGYYRIRNVNSNRCMDVAGASTSDGAAHPAIFLLDRDNQQWSFTDVASGAVRLTARHSGTSLDVYGRGTADGTAVIQWASNGGTNQQFRTHARGLRATGGTGGSAAQAAPAAPAAPAAQAAPGGTGGSGGSGGSGGGGGGSAGTRSAGCGIPTSSPAATARINVNGTTRQYVLDVPANYDPNRAYRLSVRLALARRIGQRRREQRVLWAQGAGERQRHLRLGRTASTTAGANTGGRDVAFGPRHEQ